MRLFWQCGTCTERFCLETDFVESVLLRLCNLEECRVFIVEDNILVNSIISYHWQLVGYYYGKSLFTFGSFFGAKATPMEKHVLGTHQHIFI